MYYDAAHEASWNAPGGENQTAESSKSVHDNDDALSKYSSDTLSTIRSKRSRDEDDDDEEGPYGSPPASPGMRNDLRCPPPRLTRCASQTPRGRECYDPSSHKCESKSRTLALSSLPSFSSFVPQYLRFLPLVDHTKHSPSKLRSPRCSRTFKHFSSPHGARTNQAG